MNDASNAPPETAHRAERQRTLMQAQARFNRGASTIDCTVRNISSTGARLELPNAAVLPPDFELHIPHKGRTFMAHIVWREKSSAGVRFGGVSDSPFNDAYAQRQNAADYIAHLQHELAKRDAKIRELKLKIVALGGADDYISP
ncbi:MAG: PilZ domain-containing protein [Hyphomicrobiales bacterium]|nr:PilZ domain-containing protein [Hyphomicrobiales bacterium]